MKRFTLKIPKIGNVQFKNSQVPKWYKNRTRVCSITVSKTPSQKYYVSILFEIKFNYLMDENQTAFYSQGLAYNSVDEVEFTNDRLKTRVSFDKGWFGYNTEKYHYINRYVNTYGTARHNYMSADDYVTTLESSNPINNDSFFKILIGEDVYGMKFRGDIPTMDNYKEIKGGWGHTYYKTYVRYDVDYFAASIFDSIQTLENGTSRACVFEFGDLFDYYEYDEEAKQYKSEPVDLDKAALIKQDIRSFYSILIHKDKVGATKASDSLFNCIDGSSNFNMTNTNSKDYFYGRTTINIDNANNSSEFSLVKITDSHVALKLNEDFDKAYLQYSERIELIILIDLDILSSQGLEFVGFTEDSGLDKYNVVSCKTVQTIDGQLVYNEVAYD